MTRPDDSISDLAPVRERWLPSLARSPLRMATGALALGALVTAALLIVFDLAPRALYLPHAPLSAAPLLLIGAAYLCLQPLTRPHVVELLQRLMLGSAFILWGIDQLLPPGAAATFIGDVVITLYVIDLGLIIRGHLQAGDWNTP